MVVGPGHCFVLYFMIKMLPRFSQRANDHNVLFAIISDAAKKK